MKYRVLTPLVFLFFLFSCSNNDNTSITPPVVAIDFTVSQDSIQVNPYGFTPLSALVSFTTEKMGNTVLIVKGKHGAATDVVHRFNDPGTHHSIPVIGMYADYANTVLLRIVDEKGDTLAKSTVIIQTTSLPADMPTAITAKDFDEAAVESGLILVSSLSTYNIPGRPSIPYMIDDYGDVRWVLDYTNDTELGTLFYNDGIARLKNGNFYFGNEMTNKIYEVDILGKVINNWPVGDYIFHHEVHEEANGNFILTATKTDSKLTNGTSTAGDYVVEIDRNSKQVITVWDLKESLNEYRRTWGEGATSGTIDWFHGNAVLEDTTDNTIIVSGRNQGVVKLDRSNNVKWILGPHKDWGTNRRGEDLSQFLLTPLDASGNVITDTTVAYGSTILPDFEWNSYQHSPIQLPNGDLMLFDNGTNRTLDPVDGNNAFNGAPGHYSRAVEYRIDPTNMTVQQIWQYGKERDVECYSSIVSSVQFLPEKNHVLFASGFNVANDGGFGGKVVEVDYNTKQVVAEQSINAANKFAFHRAKKIDPYPANL